MKKTLIILIIHLLILTATSVSFASSQAGKKILSVSEFLKTAWSDASVDSRKEICSFLENSAESTPYLNRVELRTKTDEFDADKQKYGLRFYPKGWNETKYSKMISDNSKAAGRSDLAAGFSSAISERYRLALEYMEASALISLKEKLELVCKDRIMVLKKKSSSSDAFDISELVETEEMLTKTKLELASLENRKTSAAQRIIALSGSNSSVDFSEQSLIGIDTVKKIASELRSIKEPDNPALRDMKNRVDLAMNKYNLEESKSRDYISFLEVSYDHDKSDDSEKAYAIEVAIKLPFINSDQDEISRRKVGYMKERMAFEEEKLRHSDKKTSIAMSIDRLVSQYEIIERSHRENSTRESLSASIKATGSDPLNILKIRESLLKSEIHLTQTGFEIRDRFMDLLDITGKLSAAPVRNYLSDSQEIIEAQVDIGDGGR